MLRQQRRFTLHARTIWPLTHRHRPFAHMSFWIGARGNASIEARSWVWHHTNVIASRMALVLSVARITAPATTANAVSVFGRTSLICSHELTPGGERLEYRRAVTVGRMILERPSEDRFCLERVTGLAFEHEGKPR